MASALLEEFFEIRDKWNKLKISDEEFYNKRDELMRRAKAQEIEVNFAVPIEDKINNPDHYKGKTLEAIQVIEDFELNYNLGNSVKYILRAGKKEDKLADLRKANWYIVREIQAQEKMKG